MPGGCARGKPMIVDPSKLTRDDAYRLMISAFIPRPIAFVSTRSRAGVDNCAPFSYSMGVSSRPMVLAVSVGSRGRRPKDTVRNILETKEFVVNVVTEDLAEKMNVASGDWADDVSEFDEAGLTRAPSEVVAPPRIAESPVNFECRLMRRVVVADNTVCFGEVVRLHVEDRVVAHGRVDARMLRAVGRLGGAQYCRTRDIFEMSRPKIAGPKAAAETQAR
ncbi:MAG: flavin reductase family protein [Methanobacteriota archaeon]